MYKTELTIFLPCPGADQLLVEHWVFLGASDTGSKVVALQNAAEISWYYDISDNSNRCISGMRIRQILKSQYAPELLLLLLLLLIPLVFAILLSPETPTKFAFKQISISYAFRNEIQKDKVETNLR